MEHGRALEAFLKSDTFTKYAWPQLLAKLNQEFPDPKDPDWQTKYIKAFSLIQAAKTLHSTLEGLANYGRHVEKQLEAQEMDINDA